MERDYDFSSTLHAADLDSAEDDRPQRRRARGRAPQSAQGGDAPRAGRVRSAHRRLAGRPSSPAPPTARSIARKTSFLRDKLGEQIFAPGIDIVDDPLRGRGLRSRPFDAEGVATRKPQTGRRRRAQNLVARLRDRARTQHEDHRSRAARRLVDALARRRPICISRPAAKAPSN